MTTGFLISMASLLIVFCFMIYTGWHLDGHVASFMFIIFCVAGGGFLLGLGARITKMYFIGELS
jgi:hypothetical protein